mmetsp:Transcript_66982/g.131894  ORF Transcript_66982/g.131894 Transcript_66982/m.131894 type:complete len:225 (+) Transcript_66982:865-1539(+)
MEKAANRAVKKEIFLVSTSHKMSLMPSVDHFSSCESHHEIVGVLPTKTWEGTLYSILHGCAVVVVAWSMFGYGSRNSSCPNEGTCLIVQPFTFLLKGGIDSKSTRIMPPTDICEESLPLTLSYAVYKDRTPMQWPIDWCEIDLGISRVIWIFGWSICFARKPLLCRWPQNPTLMSSCCWPQDRYTCMWVFVSCFSMYCSRYAVASSICSISSCRISCTYRMHHS